MIETGPNDVDVARAESIWKKYQEEHDVSGRRGQAVGVEPVSGRIWFGESMMEIQDQMLAEGIKQPFYCIRVGLDHYGRKGGRR